MLCICHCHNLYVFLYVSPGYGFVDFDSPASAQKAVTALKAGGVQAQMAKVKKLNKLIASDQLNGYPDVCCFSILSTQFLSAVAKEIDVRGNRSTNG